jgi:hypothetical protein
MNAVEYLTVGLAVAAMIARIAIFLPRLPRVQAAPAA